MQIYEFNYLILRNQINLTTTDIKAMTFINKSLYFASKDPFILEIVNFEDVDNLKSTVFYLNKTCKGNEDIINANQFFMNIYDNRLYLAFLCNLCIYDVKNQTETPIFLKYYSFIYSFYGNLILHNYLIVYRNSSFLIIFNTEDLNNITIFKNYTISQTYEEIFISVDGKYLLGSTEEEFFIKLNIDYNIETAINVALHSPHYFAISSDNYLCAFAQSYEIGDQLIVLDISSFPLMLRMMPPIIGKKINQIIFSKDNEYMILIEELGFEIIKLIATEYINITPYISFSFNYNLDINFYTGWIDISPSGKTIYTITNDINNIINITHINDFGYSISNNLTNQSGFYIYPLFSLQNKIIIYEVTNENILNLITEIKISFVNDYIITSDNNFMFVGCYKKGTSSLILFN